MLENRYIGRGVKMAAVRDPSLWEERGGAISKLTLLPKYPARKGGYQSSGSLTCIPEEPRPIRDFERDLIFTNVPGYRTDVIYVRLAPKVLDAIEEAKEDPRFQDSKRNGPVIKIFPGVHGELYGFRNTKAGSLTSSVMNHGQNSYAIDNRDLQEGTSIGIHFDHGEGLPVGTRVNAQRRLVVNMSPNIRWSLYVADRNVFEISDGLHPGDSNYVPQQEEVMERLGDRTLDEEMKVVWTPMMQGEAVLLPAYTIFHDGSSYGQEASRIAILHEPPGLWENGLFNAYTLFDREIVEERKIIERMRKSATI